MIGRPSFVTDTDLVWVPAQTTTLGSDAHYPEEGPAREVTVDGFWIQRHQVTNAQFADFVEATGYRTVAERPVDPADYPGAPAENLVPGSMVFRRTAGPVDLRHLSQWWTWTPGACWNHPRGPRSSLTDRDRHPVVHIAFEDAAAYAAWAGLSLPSEAQWETAARGGLPGATYTWGADPEKPGERRANYWHGEFPYLPESGYGTTQPVGSFEPNGYGLFDMAGNIWEWVEDWYDPDYYSRSPVIDPEGPAEGEFKVLRGGSWFHPDSSRCAQRAYDHPRSDVYCFVTGFRCNQAPQGPE